MNEWTLLVRGNAIGGYFIFKLHFDCVKLYKIHIKRSKLFLNWVNAKRNVKETGKQWLNFYMALIDGRQTQWIHKLVCAQYAALHVCIQPLDDNSNVISINRVHSLPTVWVISTLRTISSKVAEVLVTMRLMDIQCMNLRTYSKHKCCLEAPQMLTKEIGGHSVAATTSNLTPRAV